MTRSFKIRQNRGKPETIDKKPKIKNLNKKSLIINGNEKTNAKKGN